MNIRRALSMVLSLAFTGVAPAGASSALGYQDARANAILAHSDQGWWSLRGLSCDSRLAALEHLAPVATTHWSAWEPAAVCAPQTRQRILCSLPQRALE